MPLMVEQRPQLRIIAGPNGSGKTTFVREFLPRYVTIPHFAFETTLAGRTYEPMLREFKGQGYEVLLYFLWLPDVAVNLQRVAQRVQQGGHNVPEEDVRRRYRRGIANFLRVYRPLADSW